MTLTQIPGNARRRRPASLLASALIAALALIVLSCEQPGTENSPVNPSDKDMTIQCPNNRIIDGVYVPSSKPYSVSYARWTVNWWRWALNTPATDRNGNVIHPLLDDTGVNFFLGQDSKSNVIFLAGSFSSSSFTRTISIPRNKALFLPLMNTCQDNVGSDVQKTIPDLRQIAAENINGASGLELKIDGKRIPGLQSYRFASDGFSYYLSCRNIYQYFGLNVQGYVYPAVADGYYVMIAPLPVGQHTIYFHASNPGQSFEITGTYNITVI